MFRKNLIIKNWTPEILPTAYRRLAAVGVSYGFSGSGSLQVSHERDSDRSHRPREFRFSSPVSAIKNVFAPMRTPALLVCHVAQAESVLTHANAASIVKDFRRNVPGHHNLASCQQQWLSIAVSLQNLQITLCQYSSDCRVTQRPIPPGSLVSSSTPVAFLPFCDDCSRGLRLAAGGGKERVELWGIMGLEAPLARCVRGSQ